MPTLQIQPEPCYTNILAFSMPQKEFNWNLLNTNITFWTTPSLKRRTAFQHHFIQTYHHCIQTIKNFIADEDISHTMPLTDTYSFSSLNADTRSKHLLGNSRTTWNSYTTLVNRMHFYSTQANWITWPLRLRLRLPTNVPKKPLVSAVLLTTISPITALINRWTTLMLVIMTYNLMLHITPASQLPHASTLAQN